MPRRTVTWALTLTLALALTRAGCTFDRSGVGSGPTRDRSVEAPGDVALDVAPVDTTDADGSPADGPADAAADLPDLAPDASPFDGAPLAFDDGRLWLGLKSAPGPVALQRYDVDARTWTAESVLPAVTGDPFYIRSLLLPGQQGEVGLVKTVSGTATTLTAHRFTPAGAWVVDFTHIEPDTSRKDRLDYDLARESLSGDLLLVHGDGTKAPTYRTCSAGTWSSAAAVPVTLTQGTVLWVELVSRPGTDEVALLYADDQADLGAVIWSGGSWDAASAKLLEKNLKVNPLLSPQVVGNRAFDGAYEAGTGQLLVAWGIGTDSVRFNTRSSAGSWGSVGNQSFVGGKTEFVDLVAEPVSSSKRIAAAIVDMGDGTERLGLGVWDGTGWVGAKEYDSTIHDWNDQGTGDQGAAVAWVGSSGQAVCVYADKGGGTLDWYSWTSGDWKSGTDLPLSGKGVTESVVLHGYALRDEVVAVLSDDGARVYAATFDGKSWTAGPTPLAQGLAHTDAVPLSFATRP